ncbi:membrane protein insertase YidC [Evansella sp. AB-P1]|uniref:membrane protein insertase YidC n=1 Tax=Evansella sp. AB-P1 TaxID=3037653 RepID=UPI00241C11CE|nr:membrane protein insertase YidC [Evansella sp. AB-P1]MDG5787465.1 membrane protein insertase YidC [Evansella sp. AB-P1]
MGKTSVFNFFKRYSFLIITVLLLITLTGCGATNEPIDENTTGFFNHYVVYPFSFLIKAVATYFNGDYGISIILMTLMIRLALMPLMMKQYKNQQFMREKMAEMKPQMDALKEKYKKPENGRQDPETAKKMQMEMMQLYQSHNFNPIKSMGCLPMLIQFPILIGFYWAIMRTPEIAEHSFLWFNLGEPDRILPVLATLVYFIQFRTTQIGVEVQPEQQTLMKAMGLIMPIMMGVFSFSMAAALPLYWTVGGLFLIFQTLLSKWMYKSAAPVIAPSVEK